MKSPFSTEQWLTILGAITLATVFVFTTFQTKGDAKERAEAGDKRLERIEDKVDALATGLGVKLHLKR